MNDRVKQNFVMLTSSDTPSRRAERWAEEGVKPNVGLDLLRHKSFPSPAWEISPAYVENVV